MSIELKRFVVAILRPPIIVLAFVLKTGYWLLLGWWLDDRLVRRENERFAQEIRKNMPVLFTQYGAKIIPNDREPPAAFDFAKVMVSVDELLFSLTRGRGSLAVHVASKLAPNEWHELSSVLSVLDMPEGVPTQAEYYRLQTVERLLQAHMGRLKEAFAEGRYAETKERLSEVYERNVRATRRLEAQINRKLYGS
jgi:hypothetical protein